MPRRAATRAATRARLVPTRHRAAPRRFVAMEDVSDDDFVDDVDGDDMANNMLMAAKDDDSQRFAR